MKKLTDVRVQAKRYEADGIVSLVLVDKDRSPLPVWTAGSHVDVYIDDNTVRQYSLCGDPDDRTRYLLGIQLETNSRGGSRALHETVQAGDTLKISAPRNNFVLVPARHTLLIGGGIGITPLMAMAETLCASSGAFSLHYCVRSSSRAAFLEHIASRPYHKQVQVHCDQGGDSQRLDLEAVLADPDEGSHLYVCGPLGFMQHVTATAKRKGWTDACMHREYFVPPQTQSDQSSKEGSVQIASTGQVIAIGHDESVVDALMRHGIDIEVSCEQGICGTCLTGVLSGEIDHRDVILSNEIRQQGKVFTPCCSRPLRGTLVLDL